MPTAQISASVADVILELPNPLSQDRAVGSLVDIRKKSDLEEDEEPESEFKERNMTSFEFD
jgi:hypothetical protein